MKIQPLILLLLMIIFMTAGQVTSLGEEQVQIAVADFLDKSIPVAERKRRFFAFLRPVVEQENRRIIEQRQHLLKLKNSSWSAEERQWIYDLFERYKVKPRLYDSEAWDKLLLRMGTIPVKLALAQAAHESAWGRSRFARDGNNFFGQWCFRKGCGFVPRKRAQGTKHEVEKFASPAASVRAYMLNLNSQEAYRRLRLIRRGLKRTGKPISAMVLAAGLEKYSERGKAYIEDIRDLIRRNGNLM